MDWYRANVEDFGLPELVPRFELREGVWHLDFYTSGGAKFCFSSPFKEDAIQLARLAITWFLGAQLELGDEVTQTTTFIEAFRKDLRLESLRLQLQRINLAELRLPPGAFSATSVCTFTSAVSQHSTSRAIQRQLCC